MWLELAHLIASFVMQRGSTVSKSSRDGLTTISSTVEAGRLRRRLLLAVRLQRAQQFLSLSPLQSAERSLAVTHRPLERQSRKVEQQLKALPLSRDRRSLLAALSLLVEIRRPEFRSRRVERLPVASLRTSVPQVTRLVAQLVVAQPLRPMLRSVPVVLRLPLSRISSSRKMASVTSRSKRAAVLFFSKNRSLPRYGLASTLRQVELSLAALRRLPRLSRHPFQVVRLQVATFLRLPLALVKVAEQGKALVRLPQSSNSLSVGQSLVVTHQENPYMRLLRPVKQLLAATAQSLVPTSLKVGRLPVVWVQPPEQTTRLVVRLLEATLRRVLPRTRSVELSPVELHSERQRVIPKVEEPVKVSVRLLLLYLSQLVERQLVVTLPERRPLIPRRLGVVARLLRATTSQPLLNSRRAKPSQRATRSVHLQPQGRVAVQVKATARPPQLFRSPLVEQLPVVLHPVTHSQSLRLPYPVELSQRALVQRHVSQSIRVGRSPVAMARVSSLSTTRVYRAVSTSPTLATSSTARMGVWVSEPMGGYVARGLDRLTDPSLGA